MFIDAIIPIIWLFIMCLIKPNCLLSCWNSSSVREGLSVRCRLSYLNLYFIRTWSIIIVKNRFVVKLMSISALFKVDILIAISGSFELVFIVYLVKLRIVIFSSHQLLSNNLRIFDHNYKNGFVFLTSTPILYFCKRKEWFTKAWYLSILYK